MRSIIAIAGLAACAHSPEATVPEATSPDVEVNETDNNGEDAMQRAAAIDAQVTTDLERLDGLEVFEVGELVGGDASQAFNCYGPCEGADAIVDDYEQRAQALHELTEVAMAETDAATCDLDQVDTHLDALRALQVVEVGEFVSQQAAPSPYCYNLPCPADEAAAQEVNCARANTLAGLVERTSGE